MFASVAWHVGWHLVRFGLLLAVVFSVGLLVAVRWVRFRREP